jgi:hypothetical protein
LPQQENISAALKTVAQLWWFLKSNGALNDHGAGWAALP